MVKRSVAATNKDYERELGASVETLRHFTKVNGSELIQSAGDRSPGELTVAARFLWCAGVPE